MSSQLMLQPVELQEVAGRFAGEIASLRKFFLRAAIPLDTANTLPQVVERLSTERPLHRDLSSHVWVLLDESDSALHYPELLGIVTIAAAGVEHASAMREDDAHALLRFLMETKHSFEKKPQRGPTSTPAVPEPPVSAPAPPPTKPEQNALSASASSDRRSMPHHAVASAAQPVPRVAKIESHSAVTPRRQYRLAWIIAGVTAIAASVVLWQRSRVVEPGDVTLTSSIDARSPAASGASTDRAGSTAGSNSPGASASQSGAVRPEFVPHAGLSLHALLHPHWTRKAMSAPIPTPAASNSPSAAGTPPAASETRPATAPAIVNGGAAPAPTAQPTSVAAKTSRAAAVIAPVPADVLSRQLDSPRVPTYVEDASDSSQRKYPRLLHRHASGGGNGDPVLTAELRAPDLTSTAGRSGPSPSLHAEVRATVLGMMAGNLVYGPSPQYPASAASARVQGQVKIQATIDRDGTINSARVISGPPPLRDAALDAVQQWKFKPFVSGGKATPSAATAVLEFELQ